MLISDMVAHWLELINKEPFKDDSMIAKIMVKHNMKESMPLVVSLGNYFDFISDKDMDEVQIGTDEEWEQITRSIG